MPETSKTNVKAKVVVQRKPMSSDEALRSQLHEHGLTINDNGAVTFIDDSKLHPRNWRMPRKLYDTSMVMLVEFFETIISTASSHAGHAANEKLQLENSMQVLVFMTLYLIGQCLGGIVLPPYSESFGRKRLYISSTLLYTAFSALIAGWPTVTGVAIGRFMTGLTSSVPSVVICGSIEDIWDIRARVWVFFIMSTLANLGLVIGPVISPYIVAALGWRWIFWLSAIICAAITAGMMFVHESRPSIVLHHALQKLQSECHDADGRVSAAAAGNLTTDSKDDIPDLRTFFSTALILPLKLLFTEWITIAVSILAGAAIAVIYLFAEIMPMIYATYDNPPLTQVQKTVPWLALAAGFLLSSLTRLWDHHRLSARPTASITPEDKLLGFLIAAPTLAVGLWWFAWTVPPSTSGSGWHAIPWAVPTVSLVLVGWALNEFDVVLGGYLTDAYQAFAGSAFGALNLVRTIASATFPLLAAPLYNGLGYNWGGSVLAGFATAFCVVPIIFAAYGARIRQKSKFAAQCSERYAEKHSQSPA